MTEQNFWTGELKDVLRALDAGGSPVLVSGIGNASRAHFAAGLRRELGVPLCVVCPDDSAAEAMLRDLSALLKLGEERFETFDLSYYDDVPGAREQMEVVYGLCRDYAAHFGEKSVNLLFRGETGLGKTFLSACIAREVSQRGFSVVYETTVAALAAFEEQKFRGGEAAEEKVRRLLTCDLLILDDLGTEMVTEFTKSALYTLLNTRLLNGKKTIVSTNLTESQLERLYTPQICSRLQGEYQD
ncbi:MAG: ATP-binding protein, partial [Oscillospiraceae bacterium]|nr:ATP-binding protein [Oscillospiraceae bacterium]